MLIAKGLIGGLFQLSLFGIFLLVPAGLLPGGTWYWPRALWFLGLYGSIMVVCIVVLAVKAPASLEARLKSPASGKQPVADRIVTAFLILWFLAWFVSIPVEVFYLKLLPTPQSTVSICGGVLSYKRPLKTFLLLTVLSFSACTTRTPIPQTPEITQNLTLRQKLQITLDEKCKASGLKGASAAIIMPDEETWTGVSGMSDPTVNEQIMPEMLFDIGSIGKSYLAALVLQLVEEGRFTLDDPISGWLPSHPNIDNNTTIRQLLNHTSGTHDFVKHPRSPWQLVYKSTQIWTQEKILMELVDKPYFSPGNGWHYSTTNYTLLRMIAEKATETKVSTEIRNRFLIPLSLDGTIIIDPLEPLPKEVNIAHNWIGGFVDLAPKPQPWATTSPHLVYATAEDAARWMHLLYHGKKILNQKSLDQMLNFHFPTPNDPPLSGYGLGVMSIDHALAEKEFGVKGFRMWGHGGSTHGFRAIVMYLPDHGVTVSVLINGNEDEGLINIFTGLLKDVTDIK